MHSLEALIASPKGEPIARTRFIVTLPDGTKRTGETGADGYIRLNQLTQTGECLIELPDIDGTS